MGRKRKNRNNKSNHKIKIKELRQTNNKKPMKLRFSPTAWSKLLYLRDIGNTEVGGFALTPKDDLLYVADFILPKQECSVATVEFDDESVANMTDDLIDLGHHPKQFMRIWIHTHPNISAEPSHTDEETFSRVFGDCDWAVMMIISKNGDTSCRLSINNNSFGGDFEIPIEIDYTSYEFGASDFKSWADEYEENVSKFTFRYQGKTKGSQPWNYNDWTSGHFGVDIDDDFGSSAEINKLLSDEDDIIIAPHHKVKLSIPEELAECLSPNDLLLVESMSIEEREYFLGHLKEKHGL